MRVLYFTDGPLSPGSRFRCLQFFPWLERRGISCEVEFAYDERYNDVHDKPWAPLYKATGRLSRAGRLVFERGHDLLVLHKTTLAVSGLPELLGGLRATPVVFDFDDAIYLGADGAPSAARARTFRQAVDSANHVIAGNEHLAQMTRAPWKTTVVPTVVDTTTYVPSPVTRSAGDLVIGWMGTASNFAYLREVMPAVLRALEHLPRARLRVVSNGVLPEYAAHPLVEQWRWSAERELMALQSFDVGLMPLPDTEQTRGKCGFKMLQYMACGVPVVASAVGANPGLFAGSGAGLLVPAGGDWTAAVLELARRSPDERQALGAAGRMHVDAHFSVASVVERYAGLFERVMGAQARLRSKAG
ncbi:MAG: glycosyltransferase family 4 protein [Myxococcaceae bacterium]|nr:glycosyltransferase family 4 protein [Myxococcaceae bacterium]MCA3014670.1 glycosyltransferase family 4 protein [Myxococcaceae bacterium]